MAKHIARRRLFRLLGLAGVSLAVAPVPAQALARPAPADRLLRLLADPASARQIGRSYLRVSPGDADPLRLTAHLTSRLPGTPTREALAARCRQDFAKGRTVMVDGWMLAETEVKLCALATLG